jgi:arginyl-tRNA synthetase
MIREQIIKDLEKVLKGLRLSVEKLKIEHPENPEHGDFSTNVAMTTFSRRPKALTEEIKTPLDWANKIVNLWRLSGLPEYLAKIEVVQPGFINLWLKNEVLSAELAEVLKEKDDYGKQKKAKKDKKGIMFVDEPEMWGEIKQMADAVIFGVGG